MEDKEPLEVKISTQLKSANDLSEDTRFVLEQIMSKLQSKEAKVRLYNDITKKLAENNSDFAELNDHLNFKFENLSKYSQQQIEKIVGLGQLFKLRDLDDNVIISEYVNSINEESQLDEELKEKTKELERLKNIEKVLGNMQEDFDPCDNEINTKLKEFINFQSDVDDRINDILDPKSEEYQASILKGKEVLEKYSFTPDISHENLKVIHDKMLALENDIEVIGADFGDISSIPLSIAEAEKVLIVRKAKLKELEDKLQQEIDKQMNDNT